MVIDNLDHPTWTPRVALAEGETYFWEIIATDTCGISKTSPAWSFTTEKPSGLLPVPLTGLCAEKQRCSYLPDIQRFSINAVAFTGLASTLLNIFEEAAQAAEDLANPGEFDECGELEFPFKELCLIEEASELIPGIGLMGQNFESAFIIGLQEIKDFVGLDATKRWSVATEKEWTCFETGTYRIVLDYSYRATENCLVIAPLIIDAIMDRTFAFSYELRDEDGTMLVAKSFRTSLETLAGFAYEDSRRLGPYNLRVESEPFHLSEGDVIQLVLNQEVVVGTIPGAISELGAKVLELAIKETGSRLLESLVEKAALVKGSGGVAISLTGEVQTLELQKLD